MKIVMKGKNVVEEISGNKQVREILKELDLNPETVIVIKDGQILTKDQVVKDNEELEIVSVVSGG